MVARLPLTGGTNGTTFVLPVSDRPAAYVSLDVDLCGANIGQFIISPTGEAYIAGAASVSYASLDGISFLR